MFGLFQPKPPLHPWEKAWTETRLGWIADQFGMATLLETPTLVPSFAGIPAAESEAQTRELVDFLVNWMKVDGSFHLSVYRDSATIGEIESPPSQAGSHTLQVREGHFGRRDLIIAALARQLADVALEDTDFAQDAWLGDLLPVAMGLGLFATDHDVRSYSRAGQSPGHLTYLPSRMFGYALAARAYIREEDVLDWNADLRPDAHTVLDESLRYLHKTHDTVFSRDVLTAPRSSLSEQAIAEELRGKSASARIAAMWVCADRYAAAEDGPAHLGGLVFDCLRHKQGDVRAVAAEIMPRFQRTSDAAFELSEALKDRSDRVRAAAALALQKYVGIEEALVVDALSDGLQDDVRLVSLRSANSLAAFGRQAQGAVKRLLQRLRRSLNDCNDGDAMVYLRAITAISPEPREKLEEFFGAGDEEYLKFALELLAELQAAPASSD